MLQTTTQLTNQSGCFDLQFRKDTRKERTNSPTYYRWKIQFIITVPANDMKLLQKVKKDIGCGKITQTHDQGRFAVQDIDEIYEIIVPFFKKYKLSGNKKKDFDLWQKAVQIIYSNKGKYITKWKKNDLLSLIELHKASAKYKTKPKEPKWLDMALTIAKQLKNGSQ